MILTFPNRAHAIQRVSRALDNYHKIPTGHQKMLTRYGEHLSAVRAAVDINHQFVQCIVDKAVGMFDNDPQITIPHPVELAQHNVITWEAIFILLPNLLNIHLDNR